MVPAHLPSAQEAAHAQEILVEAIKQTSIIEFKTSKARSAKQLENLQPLLASARLKEAKIRAFLAPVRILPEEVLSEIFQTVHQHLDIGGWTLTQVCRVWRAVAFDTPSLWSTVKYSPKAQSRNKFGKEQCRTVRELASTFRRSKEALLDVELDLSFNNMRPFIRDRFEALSSVLDPISGRIRKLTLWRPHMDTESPGISLFTKPLTSLQQLSFHGYSTLFFLRNLLQLVDDTARNFSHMRLMMTDGTSLLPTQLTLWPRLMHLETQVPLSLSVLSGCINLRTLLLQRDLHPSWLNDFTDVVTFPHLEAATIHNPHIFFARISAPALQRLVITARFVSSTSSPPIHLPSLLELEIPAPVETYTDFCIAPLLRSMKIGCNKGDRSIVSSREDQRNTKKYSTSSLELLKLENVAIEEDLLLDILQCHSRIKELILDEVPCAPAIITHLCAFTASSPSEPTEDMEREPLLCPLLEKVTLRLGSHDCSQAKLRNISQELVAARANTCRPLAELLLFRYKHGHTTDADDLVALASEDNLGAQSDVESRYVLQALQVWSNHILRCSGCDGYHS